MTTVLILTLIAIVTILISYLIKFISYSEKEEQLPIENPEVVKPTIKKYKKSNKFKTKK
jgi:sensor domain CHASE-containing protein